MRNFSRKRKKKKGFSFFKVILLIIIPTGVFFLFKHVDISSLLFKNQYISPLAKMPFLKNSNTLISKNLEDMLHTYHIPYKSLSIDNNYGNVTLADGEKIIFSLTKPLDEQISSLQLILSRFTIEGKRFSQLDLRFVQPVLTGK